MHKPTFDNDYGDRGPAVVEDLARASRQGRRPVDPATGLATKAANQAQVSVEAVVAALDAEVWEIVIAEEWPRAMAATGVDAVVHACRRSNERS